MWRDFGFADAAAIGLQPFADWQAACRARGEDHGLLPDAAQAYPDARVLWVLAYPYTVFLPPDGCLDVPAYYFASHACYRAAHALAKALTAAGNPVEVADRLPYKAAALRTKKGFMGDNGLFFWPPFGSRLVLAVLAAQLPPLPLNAMNHGSPACGKPNVPWQKQAPHQQNLRPCRDRFTQPHPMDDPATGDPQKNNAEKQSGCRHCGLCAHACPTAALDGSGSVSMACLRRTMNHSSEKARLCGRMAQGCDLCQRACPENPSELTALPPDYETLFSIKDILSDTPQQLRARCKRIAPLLGANTAQPAMWLAAARRAEENGQL